MILQDQALLYCKNVISGKEITTDEVKIQCQLTLDEFKKKKKKDYPYFVDSDFLETVEGILSLINFATGINGVIGTPVINGLSGFQAYFLWSFFGWKLKDNPEKYRYNLITLFIARKNAKSFLAAIVLLILMLTEDDYSEFYSICLNRDLAAEIKKAMAQLINASPALTKYFTVPKTLNGKLTCKINNNFYQPRVAEADKNNSIRPTVFIADEVGAFVNKNNINAMRSGQKSVKNAIQINTTTAYANDKSVMLEELEYIKNVYKGIYTNDRMFALLYYAPPEHLWDDTGLFMANPLRIEDNYNTIRQNRQLALENPLNREEYLTKEMNHFVPKNSGEAFIKIEDLKKCRIDSFDWKGRQVYCGLDLALTTDNCSFSMVTYDDETGHIYADSFAYIPADRIAEKNKLERINYNDFINAGNCFACGDLTVSYLFIEQFIIDIEEKYGVEIIQIGYDRSNCLSTAQKLQAHGFKCVEVRQHSDTLHPATKLLEEYILGQKFHYTKNKLLEINFANAKVKLDDTLRKYVSKKASPGKVDMVVSIIIALFLLQVDMLLGNDNFIVQVI